MPTGWKKDFNSEHLVAWNLRKGTLRKKEDTDIDLFVQDEGMAGWRVYIKNQKTGSEKAIEGNILGKSKALRIAMKYMREHPRG